LVAIGGNALADPRDPLGLTHQEERSKEIAGPLADLVALGHELVVVHGNGPQVGARLLQNDAARERVPPSSLAIAVAETQGQIGHLLAIALANALLHRRVQRQVIVVVTHVLVDGDTGAYQQPSKPIGPIYDREPDHTSGMTFVHLADGGWRRVVPSPRPVEVLETDAIRLLVDHGWCVIAGGGGGVPVVDGPEGRQGVDAVVDKDYVAQALATSVGATELVMLTDVSGAALAFATPQQFFLEQMTTSEARRHLSRGEFAPGSMAPKVEACTAFVEQGGHEAIIAACSDAARAFEGLAGTRISRS
jgi:carbamate kinase